MSATPNDVHKNCSPQPGRADEIGMHSRLAVQPAPAGGQQCARRKRSRGRAHNRVSMDVFHHPHAQALPLLKRFGPSVIRSILHKQARSLLLVEPFRLTEVPVPANTRENVACQSRAVPGTGTVRLGASVRFGSNACRRMDGQRRLRGALERRGAVGDGGEDAVDDAHLVGERRPGEGEDHACAGRRLGAKF